MNILIVGCGRVGSSLAKQLEEKGHDVSVVDRSEERLNMLRGDFNGLLSCGIAIDHDVLVDAGINSCDVVCAVTDEENMNIMISQLAKKKYKVATVFTRVYDEKKGDVFETFGINTICSTALTVDAICSALDEYEDEQYLTYDGKKIKFYTLDIPRSFIGMKVRDIDFDEGEVLFAIVREEEGMRLLNNYNVELMAGDRLIFSRILG